MSSALLLQLEKCVNTTLTEQEVLFKSQIQNKGVVQIGQTGISDEIGDKLASYG